MAYLSPIQFVNSNILGTTLNGSILAGDNTLTLTSQAVLGCPTQPSFDLLIGTELITVNGISGNVCTPLSRGAGGTTPAAHTNGDPVYAPITQGMVAAAMARLDQANASGFTSQSLQASGLYAPVQTASRVVGTVAPGVGTAWTPSGGPYNVGDIVFDISNATHYVCSVGGSPGTWIAAPSLTLAQTFSAALTQMTLNRTDAAALMSHLTVQRAGSSKYGVGLDASDQFAVLNAALNAINLGITDAGIATLRNALKIPPAAGGTLAPTSYGHVGVKIDEQTLTGTGTTVTIPASGVLPTGFRHLRVRWKLKSSAAVVAETLNLRCNGSALANYFDEYLTILNGVLAAAEDNNSLATAALLGTLSGTTAPANSFGSGEFIIYDYNSATDHKTYTFCSITRRATGTNGAQYVQGGGGWVIAPVAITTFAAIAQTGNLTGTIETEGIP